MKRFIAIICSLALIGAAHSTASAHPRRDDCQAIFDDGPTNINTCDDWDNVCYSILQQAIQDEGWDDDFDDCNICGSSYCTWNDGAQSDVYNCVFAYTCDF